MKNRKIADMFYEVADILELKEVEWKPRAYRNAARKIGDLDEDVSSIYEEKGKDGLEDIPGVGSSIADHIAEYLETGKVREFEELKKGSAHGVHELIEIQGLGPKTVKKLNEELGIANISQLKEAIEDHRLRQIEGLGAKSEENLLRSIEQYEKSHERMLLGRGMLLAEEVISYMNENIDPEQINYAGSLRRMKETIGDVDILVVAKDPQKAMDTFVGMPDVDRVLLKGSTKSTVVLKEGIDVDLRVIDADSYGSAMQYFTGSKGHNIELRNIALKQGYKLSEYGLFEKGSDKKVEGKSEEGIYKKLGLSFIPPELREDRGEFEAARNNSIPKLVSEDDLKGDLHVHTDMSEGTDLLEDMVKAAEDMGYEYIAITDHSRSQRFAGGLDIATLKRQWESIDELTKYHDIKVLKGSEVDILADGSLDYPDKILKKLDIVVGSIHSNFSSSEKEMTERIACALENRYLDILGHPTGRLLGKRDAYKVDLDTIFETASDNNKVLEINSQPQRLDLNDSLILRAKKFDVKFSINTDAHSTSQLKLMMYGVGQARRGWLRGDDVVNTLSYDALKEIFDRISG